MTSSAVNRHRVTPIFGRPNEWPLDERGGMRVDAFLCDAATVREGLLHVLGGGITRIWRDRYPAELLCSLALLVSMAPAEGDREHSLSVQIAAQDGEQVASIDALFRSTPGPGRIPGEDLHMPQVLNMHQVAIPSPGVYSATILINGSIYSSLTFRAALNSERPNPR